MPYKVNFVGLVCFYREQGARLVLLPDGEMPPPGIDPHHASIIVAPEDVEAASGWKANADTERGVYMLPRCTIAIEGTDTPGTLDTGDHDGRLPQLKQINSAFVIDPQQAQTSARLSIRQGTLSAHTIPGGSAAMSQLQVPHEGPITVTVISSEGLTSTLRLAPGTEIVIGNMAAGGVYLRTAVDEDSHFRMYEKLSANTVELQPPASIAPLPELESAHWLFLEQTAINLHVSCSNTGCC